MLAYISIELDTILIVSIHYDNYFLGYRHEVFFINQTTIGM